MKMPALCWLGQETTFRFATLRWHGHRQHLNECTISLGRHHQHTQPRFGNQHFCSGRAGDAVVPEGTWLARRPPPIPQPVPPPGRGLYVIALTGGIASGKSSVAKRLAELGAVHLDADKLGHVVYERHSTAWHNVVNRFGSQILTDDDDIDRAKLGAIVFSSPKKLQELNSLVWPALGEMLRERLNDLRHQAADGTFIPTPTMRLANDEEENLSRAALDRTAVAVVEAAVLYEAGWENITDAHGKPLFHECWAAFAPPEETKLRLIERNGLTEAEASKRMASQSPQTALDRADVLISTVLPYDDTTRSVQKAWLKLLSRTLPTATGF